MSLFDLFRKKSAQETVPYKQESCNFIYDLLFCDDITLFKTASDTFYPPNVLLSNNPDPNELTVIANDASLETRYRILAYNLLLSRNIAPGKKELLGIVFEVSMPQGLDVLAAYIDGRVRYISHSEKMVIVEATTDESDGLVEKLFNAGTKVIQKIGPSTKRRKPFPPIGNVRTTFLVSDGIYLKEGPFEVLQRDPIGGPLLIAAVNLLRHVTEKMNRAQS